jgi:hypothetical protein
LIQFVKTSSSRHYPEFFRRRKKQEAKEGVTFKDNQEEYNSLLTEKELDTALSSVTGASPGLDEIHYEFLN